jgi:hypothetical protein
MRLNAMETEIGIRANQLDAWRDFTDALLAVTAPPALAERAGPSNGDDSEKAESENKTPDQAEPFARAKRLADAVISRADQAQKLLKAIDGLKSTLTQEQLEKVASLERGLHGFGRRHRFFGPRDFGPRDTGGSDTRPRDRFCARADAGAPPWHSLPFRWSH